jgi:hypothetical protein
MFHYPCLLVESGCWEWGRCRNSPPFATKCLTRATYQRKCHIVPQSAAFCTFLLNFLSQDPSAIPLVVEPPNGRGLTK